MSYRVEYQQPEGKFSIRLPFLTLWCFLLFLILTDWCWPEGAEAIRVVWMNVKNAVVFSELNYFADDLLKGDSVRQAFSDFLGRCQS